MVKIQGNGEYSDSIKDGREYSDRIKDGREYFDRIKDGREYSDKIRIRAHHLLCMQGYQGYGYSSDFEKNMGYIIVYLESRPQHLLKVVKEADAICQYCPHLKDGQCNKSVHSGPLMEEMDLLVMERLDIESGEEIRAQNIFSRVNEVFKTQKDLEGICGDCYWRDKCLWLLSSIQRDE